MTRQAGGQQACQRQPDPPGCGPADASNRTHECFFRAWDAPQERALRKDSQQIAPRIGPPGDLDGHYVEPGEVTGVIVAPQPPSAVRAPPEAATVHLTGSWPGELLHVDLEKLGNIPYGGGWRVHDGLVVGVTALTDIIIRGVSPEGV